MGAKVKSTERSSSSSFAFLLLISEERTIRCTHPEVKPAARLERMEAVALPNSEPKLLGDSHNIHNVFSSNDRVVSSKTGIYPASLVMLFSCSQMHIFDSVVITAISSQTL